jgi:hypothetical protein
MELARRPRRKRGRAEKEGECRPAARPCGEDVEKDGTRSLGISILFQERCSVFNDNNDAHCIFLCLDGERCSMLNAKKQPEDGGSILKLRETCSMHLSQRLILPCYLAGSFHPSFIEEYAGGLLVTRKK